MPSGLVFNIQKFSLQDGPGIRTTVFLKGCPLRCLWCHNPESQHAFPELSYAAEKCIACGECAVRCPAGCHSLRDGRHLFDRSGCTGCGQCAGACPSLALERIGRQMETSEVLSEVLKDKAFFESSGGGMTLSGGEPMAQPDFALSLCCAAHEAGLHVALDTCGEADWRHYESIIPFVDLFLYDIKALDTTLHKELTGTDNELILANLHGLDAAGCHIILRCPLIPGLNDDEAHLHGIAALANGLPGVEAVTVHPYHPLGIGKCRRLGRVPGYSRPEFVSEEQTQHYIDAIAADCRKTVARA